jgi:hypothetical protein
MSYKDKVSNFQSREYKGLNIGLPRFNKYLNNLNKGLIYLIGGRLGSGKSTLAMYMIIRAYLNNLQSEHKADLQFIYYSYELSTDVIEAKLASCFFYIVSGFKIRINATKFLGFGEHKLSDVELKLIEPYYGYFDKFLSCIKLMDNENPTGIWKYLKTMGEKCYDNHKVNPDDFYSKTIYTVKPEYANCHIIVISDHEGIQKKERGFTTYQNMEKMSNYRVELKNNYNFFTFIPIQQLNKGIVSTDRQKLKGDIIRPQEDDFRDCEITLQDADVVMACFNPISVDLSSYLGYNLKKLNNRFRSIHLIKNRFGEAQVDLGCLFLGEVGFWAELPIDITEEYYKKVQGI